MKASVVFLSTLMLLGPGHSSAQAVEFIDIRGIYSEVGLKVGSKIDKKLPCGKLMVLSKDRAGDTYSDLPTATYFNCKTKTKNPWVVRLVVVNGILDMLSVGLGNPMIAKTRAELDKIFSQDKSMKSDGPDDEKTYFFTFEDIAVMYWTGSYPSAIIAGEPKFISCKGRFIKEVSKNNVLNTICR